MKFKVGDRVYYESMYSVLLTGTGVIDRIYEPYEFWVLSDVEHDGLSRVVVELSGTKDVLLPMYIYNSPLYKALR